MNESPIRNVSLIRSLLLALTGLGTLVIGYIHASTFFDPKSARFASYGMGFFPLGFVGIGGYLYLMFLRQPKQNYRSLVLKHAWFPSLLVAAVTAYAAWNFFASVGQGSTPAEKTLLSLRAFSGHGLAFVFAPFCLAWADALVEAALRRMKPTPEFSDVFQSGRIALPAGQYKEYNLRMNETGWKTLKWVIGVQAVVISAFAIVTQVYFYLFVAAFISLNLTNFFWFRKQVRYSIHSAERNGSMVTLTYHDYDEQKQIELPVGELRVAMEVIPSRSVTKIYKMIWSKGEEELFQFRCDIGFWTEERCRNIVETVDGWKVS